MNFLDETPWDTPLTESGATVQHPSGTAENASDTSVSGEAQAWRHCRELASSTRILDRFGEDLTRAGFAGDIKSAQTLFLSMVSRLLATPVSVVLKGLSSGGKSFLLKTVLAFFPPNAYHEVTSLTPKALSYLTVPMAHRMLVVAEYEGLQAKGVEYQLRILLSDGHLSNATPVNRGGRWETEQFVLEGPTGLLVTTTRLQIHPENETRMLSLEIKDTEEQTQAIFRAQAREAQGRGKQEGPDYSVWHIMQFWLSQGNGAVVIPYADEIATQMPAQNAVQMRRNFPKMLQMVMAHALLHKANRGRDTEDRIIATWDDYAVVYDLIAELMAEMLEIVVPDDIRETVEVVRRLVENGRPTTLAAVAQELRLDKSSVSRRVKRAVAGGHLINLESRRGCAACLRLGEEMPGQKTLFPHPDLIRGKFQ